jgi:NAD(P)-dependent dehydrogenase (short-subunit alcohol dehydrogenase family)
VKRFEGKTAVVTGGSSGIGLATAKQFVSEGAHVFITGRREAELERAARSIARNVTAVAGDIADLGDLDRLYAAVASAGRGVDVVVANAGVVELATTAQATPEHFDKTFGVNARGTFFTVQKALPLLNDAGAVVLVSSAVSLKGFPQYATYAASKAALRSFTRSWAMELKDRKVRVNVVSPGPVDTPIQAGHMGAEAAAASNAAFTTMAPIGRIGTPEDIAAAVLFLASTDSSFVTGVELVADGGFTQI